MKLPSIILLTGIYFLSLRLSAQTPADTLRGSNGPGRVWWHVLKYDLHVRFNCRDQTLSGYNTIYYKVLKKSGLMQIDLQEPMIIDSCPGTSVRRDGNTFFLENLPEQKLSVINSLTIYFHGKPKISHRPPWDGGLVWSRDGDHNPWISIACQGIGASVWYPCKEYQGDKADSAELHITCPDTLIAVSNGRFRGKTKNEDGTATFDWFVSSPISNYCLIPYIGKYVHFSEIYSGEKGNLDLDYWVLQENLDKAKIHFAEVQKMLKAFEYWFGPYPFYADGYKLTDAPFLGMEHQSAIAYGNGYKNGYEGRDFSNSGWGMKWDFIIVHESAHEWFGNSITAKDIADMWIHEGFANYSETLFTEYYFGKEAGSAYCIGNRKSVKNDKAVIGLYGINKEGSEDMYDKAGNMLHTLRQLVNDDEKFRKILRGLNRTFYHETVTTAEVEDYISREANCNLSKVFDQYLRTVKIPVLEYRLEKGELYYRWGNCVQGFSMPVKVTLEKGIYTFIYPTETLQKMKTSIRNAEDFKADENFYVNLKTIKAH